VQVGSTMSKSPGEARRSRSGCCPSEDVLRWLPPIVTVTVSIDCLAFDGAPAPAVLAVVMTSSPHLAAVVPAGVYCACCCTAQFGTPTGTLPVMSSRSTLHSSGGERRYRCRREQQYPAVLPKP